jgi:Response regulator receiver domain
MGMARLCVLVVDDEEDVREVVETILSDAGFAVATAGDGAAALEIVAKQPVDLAVVDVWLPGELSGLIHPIRLNCNSLDGMLIGASRSISLRETYDGKPGWRHFESSFFIRRMTLGNLFWQSGMTYILPILRPPWFRPGLSLEPSLQGGRRWLASVSWRTA